MRLPRELIGWHGIGDSRIIKCVKKSDGYHVTLDLSRWVDEEGYGESASGFIVKKVFPTAVIILENPRLDRVTYEWEADRILVGRGRSRLNRYHAILLDKPDEGANIKITFPHKVKEVRRRYSILIDAENLTIEEIMRLRELLSGGNQH